MYDVGNYESDARTVLVVQEGCKARLEATAVGPSDSDGSCSESSFRWEQVDNLENGPSAAPLPRRAIICYGIGHMLNDITAACWFTYLLIFLTRISLSPSDAAIVMLSGQVADGIATIIVGELIDRFGHYKLWHGGGSILVAISFSSVFGGCWVCTLCGTDSQRANTIAYSIFAAIFNIGWAATQVSHMSLVNCLTTNSTSRIALSSCRNACTMVANLCLFAIAYVIFRALPSQTTTEVEGQYRWISLVSILFGSCFVVVFLGGVKEPRLQHLIQPKYRPRTSYLTWFKKILYHQVALVYMLTRLTTNVSQALLAFFLIDDLKMGDSSKAVVPAVIYICSFLVSIGLQEMGGTTSHLKIFFTGGASLWILSGVVIFILESNLKGFMYALSVVLGIGNALMTVTAVSMQGVLVGVDLSGCAFVYGSLSFLEKFSCGIALYIIESFHSTGSSCDVESLKSACHKSTVRLALALAPGTCALLGVLVTCTMNLGSAGPLLELKMPLLSPRSQCDERDEMIHSEIHNTWKSGAGERRDAAKKSSISPNSSEHVLAFLRNPQDQRKGPSCLWRRLARAMVGRWGSPRPHSPVCLE